MRNLRFFKVMKNKKFWTELLRFAITVLSALAGTAGMQSCGMI